MRRDLDTFRRWVAALEDDVRSSLDGVWRLDLDDSFVLTVRRDDRVEEVLLDDLVAEDAWPPAAWETPRRDSTLEHDAAEALATELHEVLRLWDVAWTTCSEHRETVFVCSGVWICPGSPTHEIAIVGRLPSPDRY